MKRFILGLFIILTCYASSYGQSDNKNELKYQIETYGNFGGKDFIPFYQVSNKYGTVSNEDNAAYLRGQLQYKYQHNDIQFNTGLDLIGTTTSSKYFSNNCYLQQLYAQFSWKKFGIFFGAEESKPMLVNQEMSSGNMLWSGNARPIPQFKIGTTDFISVVGTKGWLNLYWDIAYGRQVDGDYNKHIAKGLTKEIINGRHCHIPQDVYFHRKNLFLKSKIDAPFVFTFGIEHIAQFGGKADGKKCSAKGKDFANVFFLETNSGEYEYSHLASIDLKADVNIKKNTFSAYVQLFMDDICKTGPFRQNKTDGLWGLEWKTQEKSFLSNIVVEYLKTTNQGGPLYANGHYDGEDFNYYACTYYNDQHYGAWAHYGMACGNPLLKSPIYNEGKYPGFTDTLVKGIHVGLKGFITSHLTYRMFFGHQKSWGEPMALAPKKRDNTSGMIECTYQKNGWSFTPSLAFDKGSLYNDNLGFSISIKKEGLLIK